MNRIRQTCLNGKQAALLASILSTIALCGTGGVARADDPIRESRVQSGQYSQPGQIVPGVQGMTSETYYQDRQMVVRTPNATTRNIDKAGRFMMNVRGGLAMGIANADQDLRYMAGLGLDIGVAVSSDYNAYLILTPQLDLRPNFFNVMVPLGFQYDIRLARGLYLYPRTSIGYSAMISNPSVNVGSLRLSDTQTTHGGVVIPELGLKYIINGRFNLGVEPLSVPVFFTGDSYAAWYRMNVFVGGNF